MKPAKMTIAIIGGGPAGLMAATHLARSLGPAADITVFEHMPSPARKFLLAGCGGLNLTHSTPMPDFLNAYGDAAAHLAPALAKFSPEDLRKFADGFDEATFVGSSGRVFPKSFKASPLLRGWLRDMQTLGVSFKRRHRWLGWGEHGTLKFETPEGRIEISADVTILALGGASWAKLGSDGHWVETLRNAGIDVAALEPSNCGFDLEWSPHFAAQHAGAPLKSVQFNCGEQSLRGEAIVTANGLEGGAIYALSRAFRRQIKTHHVATLTLDLRPDVSLDSLKSRLSAPRNGQSGSSFLRKAGLSPVQIGLLREVLGKDLPSNADVLARAIKTLTLKIIAPRPIDRAISSAGGVRFQELDAHLMLRKIPGVFVCGEMLDFDAPTGGYLLQAAFSTGVLAADGAIALATASAPHTTVLDQTVKDQNL